MKRFFLRLFFTSFVFSFFFFTVKFLDAYQTEESKRKQDLWLETKAWELTNQLSDSELAGQVIHIAIPGTTLLPETEKELQTIRPGGIILFGKNLGKKNEIFSLTTSLQKGARSLQLYPLWISTDQEGGRVFRVQDGATPYPGAMAVGQTGRSEFGETVGFVTSYELRSLGINLLFAPVLDINNNPMNPVINTRSFGSDAKRVTDVGVAYEMGARAGGCLPVIKHFPGHGDTTVDSHLGLPIIEKTYEELKSLELIPFAKAIQNGAEGVMSAHIVYPKIDAKLPATLSPKILTNILRKNMGFEGLIITDAMEMHAISKNYESVKPGVQAIKAGVTIVLLTSWGETARRFLQQIESAQKSGEFEYQKPDGTKGNILREAVQKQIRKKLEYGLFDENSIYPNIYKESPTFLAYLQEKEKERKLRYAMYAEKAFFLKEINEDSIRSYPIAVPKISFNASNTISFVKNKILQKTLEKNQIPSASVKDFPKLVSQKEILYFLYDSTSEREILTIADTAKKNPKKTFFILHGGTPFVQLPKEPNLFYLFSFSLTQGSWEALAERLLQETEIPTVDLILLQKENSTPSIGAFPERL